ncbi:Hypothetical predicted protein [Cloeon dipterum]|uniref:Uncharacterized protein n=1 Tax=Cloeon dipterum TaxID=197152 RepID=A0A8S1E859_9INSE|nr:Hypothetical predicted protein [Cloeon dipterum]
MTLQLSRDEEAAVKNITLQQIAETDLETLNLNLLVDNLRMSRRPLFDLRHLAFLPLSSREYFLRKLASADKYEEEENKIGSSRLLTVLITILEKPICNLDLTGFTINDCYMEIFLEAVLIKLAKNSTQLSLRWHSLPRLKNLTELHLPNYVLRGLDFESIAVNFPSLLLLECNLESTLSVDRMLQCLGSIGKLQRFIFNVVPPKNLKVPEQVLCEIYTWACVFHHPTLKVMGYAPEFRHRHVSRVCHALQEGDARRLNGESSLEHLVVQLRVHPRQVEWHSGHARSLCALRSVERCRQ